MLLGCISSKAGVFLPGEVRHRPFSGPYPSSFHDFSSGYRRQRVTEHLACGPPSARSPSCHCWRPLSIPRPHWGTHSLSCLNQGHAQRGMRTHKMIIGLPSMQMSRAQWGVCRAVAHVRRASAATPRRIVRLTRSIKAVFTRPEKPSPCNASLKAGSVPSRNTCLTCTSLRVAHPVGWKCP